MDLKQNTLMIGLGNCGCKIAKQFYDLGYKAMYANGSVQDLKALGDIPGIYRLRGYDGFGGHRERAMDCLSINEEFVEELERINRDIIFIIYAAGGSTGSGLSTIVAQYLKQCFGNEKIICTVCVLPADDESITRQKNAYEAVQELAQLQNIGLGASFFLDNNTSDHKRINKKFVTLLDTFLDDDSWGEENNFDAAERLEMLSESGAMLLALSEGDSTDQLLKGGIFAPLQGDKIVGNICVIHSDKYDINVNELIEEIGRPLNIYEGYGADGSLIAVSGVSFPIDHTSIIGKLAIEGQRERQRNIDALKKMELPALNFGSTKPAEMIVEGDRASSSIEKLVAMRNKKKEEAEATKFASRISEKNFD